MRLGVLVLMVARACAAAAYAHLPFQHCDDRPRDNHAAPDLTSLSGALQPLNHSHSRLTLRLVAEMAEEPCRRWARELPTGLMELDMLGRAERDRNDTTRSCFRPRWAPTEDYFELDIFLVYIVPSFVPVSTFTSTIRLYTTDRQQRACLRTRITPALTPTARFVTRYTPLGVLAYVLAVGILRSLVTVSDPEDDDEAEPQPVLPLVGDCLHHLQHIFLTASLSLFYPGFLISVASQLSWFSLFSRGFVPGRGRPYPGVEDGLYSINGTYGGTFGLETMTQVIGAPPIMGTWTNMVVLFLIGLGISAFLVEFAFLVKGSKAGMVERSTTARLRRTSGRVLQIALSYFMVPLVSLSLYQVSYAGILPVYHVLLAGLMVVIVVASFAWLFHTLPTVNLGILLFHRQGRYGALPTGEGPSQHDGIFVSALFTLNFIRGIAIGGLQISGLAQLVVLGVVEVVLLICIAVFQAYPALSLHTASAVVRLVVLSSMVAFIPGVSSDKARSVIGYSIIVLHALVLLGQFLQATRDLVRFVSKWRKLLRAASPGAYHLDQLSQRTPSSTHRPAASPLPSPDPTRLDVPGRQDASIKPRVVRYDDFRPIRPAPPRHTASTASSNRFYRPPRSVSRASSGRASSQPSSANQGVSSRADASTTVCSAAYSHSLNGTSSSSSIRESHDTVRTAKPKQSHESLEYGDFQVPRPEPSPGHLGPRWNDYSFRESDLYYRSSPQPLEEEDEEEARDAPSHSRSLGRTTRDAVTQLWKKGQRSPEPASKGFEVVRRRPPPLQLSQSSHLPASSCLSPQPSPSPRPSPQAPPSPQPSRSPPPRADDGDST